MGKWAEMSARERDALVAEKVMGWSEDRIYRAEYVDWPGRYIRKGVPLDDWQQRQNFKEWEYCGPHFTGEIGAMWAVFKTVGDRLFSTKEQFMTELQRVVSAKAGSQMISFSHLWFFVTPEAICLAALRAVGAEV